MSVGLNRSVLASNAWAIAQRAGVLVDDQPPNCLSFIDWGVVDGVIESHEVTHYRLRMLFPPSLARGAWSVDQESITSLVPELFWTHCTIYQRRFDAQRPVSAEDAATLVLAISVAKELIGATSELLQSVERGAGARLAGEATSPRSNHLSLLERAVRDETGLNCAAYASPVRAALVKLIIENEPKRLGSQTFETLKQYLDVRSGLFRLDDASSSTPATGRLFISALVPLAMALACRRLRIPLKEPAWVIARPRLESADPSLDTAKRAELLVRDISTLRIPPYLPASWSPQLPDSTCAELESVFAQAASDAMLHDRGWSVRVHASGQESPCVLSIRHDVDRRLSKDELETILVAEARLGIRSSWYFKPETFVKELGTRIRDAGSEVGWHASRIDTGDDGFWSQLRDWCGVNTPGVTFHGGPGSMYWNGMPAINHAARLGCAYAEMLTEFISHPSSFTTESGDMMLTPLSVKFDAYPAWLDRQMDMITNARGHAIIENHPDLFGEQFIAFVEKWIERRAIGRTVGEQVKCCRALEQTRLSSLMSDDGSRLILRIECAADCWISIRTDRERWRIDHPSVQSTSWMEHHAGETAVTLVSTKPV